MIEEVEIFHKLVRFGLFYVWYGGEGGFYDVDGFLARNTLGLGKDEIETAESTATANDCWEAIKYTGAIVVARNRKDATFVAEDTVDDVRDAGTDTVVSRAFAVDDFVDFVAGGGFDFGADIRG